MAQVLPGPRQPRRGPVAPRGPAAPRAQAVPRSQVAMNRYALFLADPPVSARFASRDEMQAVAGVAYRQRIEAGQASLRQELSRRNILVTGSVSTLLNAVFVAAGPERLAELESLPGVIGVRPLRRGKPTANKAVGLMNGPAAWATLGGQQKAGAGIKIAIIDTGIDQTHPAFQDSTLTAPAGFPLCTAGHPEDCAYTNSKVIVARSYVRMLAAGTGPADSSPDDFSPRDRVGHGTAVAAIAAGAQNTGTVTFNGMAPKAFLGSYKVYGSPGVNDGSTEDVYIAAIEDAVKDGMDVANFSSGVPAFTGALDTGSIRGLAAGAPCDPLATAFEAAAKAGLAIAVSAGNDGASDFMYPSYNSISSPATAPSVIGAGATLNSHVLQPTVSATGAKATSAVVGIPAQLGDSFFIPSSNGASQAALVDVTQLGDNGFACGSLPAYSVNGAFALIENNPSSSNCDISTSASNAQAAGAIGVIFYMATSQPAINPEGLSFVGPVVMISNQAGVALKNFIDANPGTAVIIDTAGMEQDLTSFSQFWAFSPALIANQLASYSSLGPTPDGAIKPDIVATGGFDPINYPDINDPNLRAPSGMYSAGQKYDPNGEVYTSNGYEAADGTSFAAPLTAGAAALVKQAHPGWTATQIKSALVNGAAQTVTTDDFGTPLDVQSFGGGLLDANAGVNASVTAEPSTVSFGFLPAGTLASSKTLTISNKGASSVTLASAVVQNTPAAGTTLTATPASLTIPAGGTATLTVSLAGTVPVAGEYSGLVTLQSATASLRIPFMYLVGSGSAFNLALYGGGQGVANQDAGPVLVQVTDENGAPVANTAIPFTVSPRRSATLQSSPGFPACTPASSTSSVSCSTNSYGWAAAEVILGPTSTVQPTINLTALGQQIPISYTILPAPAITAAGIIDNAAFQAPVAPGSYIAIFGQNLVDPLLLVNPNGDLSTPLPGGALPLMLDGVTVSFDVPSAGISVPGYVTFVSSGQVNVWVPRELQGQSSVQVKLTVDEEFGSIYGNVVTIPLNDYAPQMFQIGTGIAAAEDLSGNVITSSNPIARGQYVVLYANGLGPVTNSPASGDAALSGASLSQTTTPATVTIGGQTAQVLFSGLAPGFAGLYQLDVLVPASLSAGSQPVTISIGGKTSQTANITVK